MYARTCSCELQFLPRYITNRAVLHSLLLSTKESVCIFSCLIIPHFPGVFNQLHAKETKKEACLESNQRYIYSSFLCSFEWQLSS